MLGRVQVVHELAVGCRHCEGNVYVRLRQATADGGESVVELSILVVSQGCLYCAQRQTSISAEQNLRFEEWAMIRMDVY